MKRFVLFIFLLLNVGILPTTAQETCDTAAANATVILDTALTLLQTGNVDGATTLISTARDSLATCTASEAAATPSIVEPTTEPSATSAATEPDDTETTGSGEYTVVNPEVDINRSIAFVRFAHTSVDGGSIDIYRGRDSQPIVARLDFGEVTDLIPIPAGEWLFTARPTGTGTGGDVLYQMRWNYVSNSSWVVTAAGVRETSAFILEPLSIIRNNYRDMARVRVINLVAGAPRITVTALDGTVLGNGLGWVDLRDNMIAPGEYILDAQTSDGRLLVTPQQFTFEANITYTLMAMGGFNGVPLQFLAFETPQELTRVRFINNRIDVLDMHYRPGNELLISTFDPQTETDWYEFPSGAVTFVAVEPNAGAFGRELAALPWQLRPGRDMTIEITQNGMQVIDIALHGYED
ncbi:MAG: DUF4397 domain-containing protein [Anaerolineae bacterium]|nr:DUF4397 domain-containing protein [Anaerolineae bacterium]